MRKYRLVIVAMIGLFLDCADSLSPEERAEMEFRKIAYNSLDDKAKKTIITNWKKAKISRCKYTQGDDIHLCVINPDKRDFTSVVTFITTNQDIILKEDQELVTVTFNTKDDALLGPIIVIIDARTKVVVGFVTRE